MTKEIKHTYDFLIRKKMITLIVVANLLASSSILAQDDQVNFRDIGLGTPVDLSNVFFLDNKSGWVSGKKRLFKTEDGGKLWKSLDLRLLPYENLSQVFFHDVKVGTLVVQKSNDGESESNYFRVLRTTDGGKSWAELKTVRQGIVRRILFSDRQNGWIVGYRKKGMSLVGYKYLVLRTKDGGKTWSEISDLVKSSAGGDLDSIDYRRQRNVVLDAFSRSNYPVTLFLSSFQLLVYTNASLWQSVKVDPGKIPGRYGTFVRFGFTEEGNLWWAATADSVEGTYGELVIHKSSSLVERNVNHRTHFSDIAYLGKKRYMVAGHISKKWNAQSKGIVLYTEDGGENWRKLYEDENVSTFSSIFKRSPKDLIVVGQKGKIIEIELSF